MLKEPRTSDAGEPRTIYSVKTLVTMSQEAENWALDMLLLGYSFSKGIKWITAEFTLDPIE